MNWNDYQEEVAEFFRSIGADGSTNVKIKGARGHHALDVLVRFKQFGLNVVWVVECKLWASSIPKEKILVLQQVVQDVGADKGLIMSEAGFQSGAIRCATQTNIYSVQSKSLK